MRKIPFTDTVLENPEAAKDYRVNLLERIQMKTRQHQEQIKEPEQPVEGEQPTQNPPVNENGTGGDQNTDAAEPSAIFEEVTQEPEDPADTAADKMEKIILENPEELAELLVELGNVVRIIFGPGLYEGLMYPGQERNDIRGVVVKSIENEKANKDPMDGFNNYEKRLFEKWPKLQSSIQNISFSEEQVKKLAKYLGQDIERVGVPEFISNHRWILYYLALELGKSKEIIQGRATDAFAKKFGLG